MGVDIKLYRARIGLFDIRQRKLPVNSYDKYSENCAHMVFWNYNCCYADDWRSRIESRAANRRKAIEFMLEQREEMKGICE
jgi:hypothetical protein